MKNRLITYLIGLMLLALGVSLNTQTGLGLSPIISIAYLWSQGTGLDFSLTAFFYNLVLCVVQILLYSTKGKIPWLHVAFQIPAAFLSSAFMSFYFLFIPNFASLPAQHWLNSLAARLVILLIAFICIGIGASMMIQAKLSPMPPDGVLQALALYLPSWRIGSIKNLFDASSAAITLLLSFVLSIPNHGIGIGTILGVVCVGRVMAWAEKWMYSKR